MPEFIAPGIYVEEVTSRVRPIEGVSSTIAAFVGFAEKGPTAPTLITSFVEYEAAFGRFATNGYLPYAAQGFFQNGGQRCYILRLASDVSDAATALSPLGGLNDISIVCCPDEHGVAGMTAALVAHCEEMRYRIAVLGAPSGSDLSNAPPQEAQSCYAAYYAPWVLVATPAGGAPVAVHPGGHVAGGMVANDVRRAISKAPANIPITGIVGLERRISAQQQAVLNPRGVNVLRNLPGRGYRVWGARTTTTDPEWKYVNIRRYFIYLEKSIERGLQWALFEPNGDQLWASVRQTIENFLQNEWLSGALLGDSPSKAYFVRCDRTTMTQDDIDNGRLVCLIGVAALKPAEFVIFRIAQWTADAKSC